MGHIHGLVYYKMSHIHVANRHVASTMTIQSWRKETWVQAISCEKLIVERKAVKMESEISSFDSLNESVQQTSPKSSSKRKASKEHHAKVIKKRALHSGDGKRPENASLVGSTVWSNQIKAVSRVHLPCSWPQLPPSRSCLWAHSTGN